MNFNTMWAHYERNLQGLSPRYSADPDPTSAVPAWPEAVKSAEPSLHRPAEPGCHRGLSGA